MVQAASTGAVDFRRADPRDPDWYARLRIICRAVERSSVARLRALEASYCFAMLTRADLTDQGYEHYQAEAARMIEAVRTRLFPWVKAERGGREASHATLERLWIETWGDPRDPATAAQIEATAEALRRGDRSRRG